jgi:uncharacterized protein YecE (DUF72 family)
MASIRVGTAGWNVPQTWEQRGTVAETHLERYAKAMNCVEVNSSFYRPHQRKTWERWAAATPTDFRFAVKAPKTVTHIAKLRDCNDALIQFFEQVAGLDSKLGPVLFQFAPGHAFDQGTVRDFLGGLRKLYNGPVALEPRNASWFVSDADVLLREFEVARVAADPAKGSPLAAKAGGFSGLRYYRLHGSPRVYWSSYDVEQLQSLAAELGGYGPGDNWIIFDNTAAGEAFKNAMELKRLL